MAGIAAAQGVEAEPLMGKIDLAAYQSVRPVFGDVEGLCEERHLALVVTATQVDHRSLERDVEVELKLYGERSAVGCGFSPGSGFAAVSGNVTCGDGQQTGEVGAMVALPDLVYQRALKPSMAFWKPCSRGGANTGITFRLRHSRLTRPTVSANW